jgi:glycerophosphoryl diester phosphodiesterase
MKNILTFIISCIILLNSISAQTRPLRTLPPSKNKIIVIAHRGDHTNAPENSILAIQNAIEDGVDYVELDIRTTLDGRLILMHDVTVNRMTNGTGKIRELTYDSIRSLKFLMKNNIYADTTKVPNFEEVLQICKDKINIYLDFKDANVEQVYSKIVNANMQNQFVVYINSASQYVQWRKTAPNMPLILSLNTKIKDSLSMTNYLNRINIDILDGNWTEYTNETVRSAFVNGVPVWADMQSNQEDEIYWQKGLNLGLLGIQTDHPKELIKFLHKIYPQINSYSKF